MSVETQEERLALARERMVDAQLRARGIGDARVLQAMARVPRHEFVEPGFQAQAYRDHPLPIGQGQTVSQPYIVAISLQALALQPTDRVLEIGTGSGYQTALLAELAFHVYSIERHASLAAQAESVLKKLGYQNITCMVGDGNLGLPQYAPYEAIAVSAASAQIPPPLGEQLSEGGRMVIPVGPPEVQELVLVRKHQAGLLTTRLEGCRFVPLVRD
ncbi:MAG TPA: protein-L-isoaspartate(D-aspartate) O-methyltransferase [Terriglobales bacterium]|jgi:protein-L-isoaspartate(D-aspartate) O-methyltransferase